MKNYTQEQYNKLVEDVESELSALLAKSESEVSQPLTKAEEKPEDKKEESQEESKDEPKAEAKAEDKKEDEKKEEPKDEESCDYDDNDMEEMHKMYGSMSKGELKAHKESVEKCWMAKCGDMQQMAKSETPVVEVKTETKQEEDSQSLLIKSENETLKKENEDLKKNVEQLVASMNAFLVKKAPERKAVTDISFIAKSEEKVEVKPLSKSEVHRILATKTQDPSLSKSDRELINKYYLNNAAIETVSHLLK